MRFDKNAPRYQAGHGELNGGTGGITRMCTLPGHLELYKVDKTFRLYTPEALDPEETDPNMHWMSKPVADVGSANKIVARVFIQASEALAHTPIRKELNKDDIVECMHRCKEQLLVCERRQLLVRRETERICQLVNREGIKKTGFHLTDFPQVDQLEEHCAVFLSHAKLVVQTLAELINSFYRTTFDGPRFDKILSWANTALKENTEFLEYLKHNSEKLKYIVDLRNAQEHPKTFRKLIIENFTLKPGNVIAPPAWHISGDEPYPIQSTMHTITEFLSTFAEVLFLYCLMDSVSSSFSFRVREIEECAIDKTCPIRYVVEPDIVR